MQEFTSKKADELEAELGGNSTRSREVQEHEGRVFQGHFKSTGIQYVEPLVMKKQQNVREEEFPTRLYHLKVASSISFSL